MNKLGKWQGRYAAEKGRDSCNVEWRAVLVCRHRWGARGE